MIKTYYGEGIFFQKDQEGLTRELEELIRTLLLKNHGVGIMGGYYEEGLPICMVSELTLQLLGYASLADFERQTGCQLTHIICGEPGQVFSEKNFSELSDAFEVHIRTADGSVLWVRQVKCDVRLQNGRKMWMISLYDMDEVYKRELRLIEAKEEAERGNRAKNLFLSRMSHDIRTPINGILGMTRIGLEHLSDPEVVKDSFEKIRSMGNQLEFIINEILDITQLESGRIELLHEPFDLRSELESIAEATASQAPHLKFYGFQFEESHDEVVGSAMHIRRLLENILSNAVKYNQLNGSIECCVEEEPMDESHALYRFIVRDTGIGMSEAFQKRMFELFSQENGVVLTEFHGTGLGLPIAKKLADLMGGNISINSIEGKGTTVTVELPLEIVNREQHSENIREEKEGKVLKDLHILLVEDNALNREIAQYILEQAGAVVETAENGEKGVRAFLTASPGTYDIILMDIMMPVLDGLGAAREIRSSGHSQAKTIPIIAMTANAFADDIRAVKMAGMNAHLAKPVDEKKMIRFIRELTGKK